MKVRVQKEVAFYDDQLTAVQADDGHIYVSLSQMCGAIGLAPRMQRRRIEDHDVLGEGLTQLAIQTAGGKQTAYMLRHDLVPLWLAGIQGRLTSDEVRKKLKRYQMEAAKVLNEAFQEGRLTIDPDLGDLALVSPESLQALQMAHAIVALARNQVLLEQRLGGRIDNLESRLDTVEDALAPKNRYVSIMWSTTRHSARRGANSMSTAAPITRPSSPSWMPSAPTAAAVTPRPTSVSPSSVFPITRAPARLTASPASTRWNRPTSFSNRPSPRPD